MTAPRRQVRARTRATLVVAAVVALSALVFVACGSNGAGPTPSDPVLAQGQQVYQDHCRSCHGPKGQGGSGVKLAGKVADRYPNIADQETVIANGLGSGMPAWKNSLSADEIAAVARYERECLGTTC